MPGSFRPQTTDHHKPDVLWTSICMHRHKIQIKIKLRPVMFDISQYNDGCSPALTFKTSNRGLGPRTVACSILVSYNQLLDMIHARVDCDCNGQRTVINDGNWAQQWRHNEFSCNQYQSWAHNLMTSWVCRTFSSRFCKLQVNSSCGQLAFMKYWHFCIIKLKYYPLELGYVLKEHVLYEPTLQTVVAFMVTIAFLPINCILTFKGLILLKQTDN